MLQFVRQIPLRIVTQGALSDRRGFLFYASVGFHKDVDPLSGMSVNLVKVNACLAKLKSDVEKEVFSKDSEGWGPVFSQVLLRLRQDLVHFAEQEGAQLTSLLLLEERGLEILWDTQEERQNFLISHKEYLESYKDGKSCLLGVRLRWMRHGACHADYRDESLRILKTVKSSTRWLDLLGQQLESGTYLHSIEVTDPASKSSLLYR